MILRRSDLENFSRNIDMVMSRELFERVVKSHIEALDEMENLDTLTEELRNEKDQLEDEKAEVEEQLSDLQDSLRGLSDALDEVKSLIM